METRHPVDGYFGNEFPSICNHRGVMAAGIRKTLKKVRIFAFFYKNDLSGNFSKFCFENFHRHTDRCVQISWNLADGKSWNRALLVIAYLTNKKNKISPRSTDLITVHMARKICQGQPQTVYSECSRFHPNRFAFGGFICERVITIRSRSKVSSIFD